MIYQCIVEEADVNEVLMLCRFQTLQGWSEFLMELAVFLMQCFLTQRNSVAQS